MTSIELARYINHTLFKPNATRDDLIRLCSEARRYDFFSVCVNPTWVAFCANLLSASRVKICSVVGFPLGANMAVNKANEALTVFNLGAAEIDMVINIGALKSGGKQIRLVEKEIQLTRTAVPEAVLKVIIETCLLNDDEKVLACEIALDCGADFVKTSTGFSTSGARPKDIALMCKVVGNQMGIEASGGIRYLATAKAMLEAGATRLGCSNSVDIILETKQETRKLDSLPRNRKPQY